MGLFSRNYDRPGPGVPKDLPPKKGLARYFEMLGRDFGNLVKVNLLFFVCTIPLFAAFLFLVDLSGNPVQRLIGVLAITLAAFPVGPALCGMVKVTGKMTRDIPGYVWHDFKEAFTANLTVAAPIGMVYAMLWSGEVLCVVSLMTSGMNNLVLLVGVFLGCLLLTATGIFFFRQLVALELGALPILKNSLLLTFAFVPRTIPASVLLLACIVAQLLYLPLTVPVLLVVGFSLPSLAVSQIVWPIMKKTFYDPHSEENAES